MSKNKEQAEKDTTVDIDKESGELETYGPGSLEKIDEKKRIDAHWFRERIMVILSTMVILAILVIATVQLFTADPNSQDWGRQTLGTLLGFAVGAIWQFEKKK